ncbi:MAG: sigma 54-interacting transcriptional regulator [Aeromonadaceae bacterium]
MMPTRVPVRQPTNAEPCSKTDKPELPCLFGECRSSLLPLLSDLCRAMSQGQPLQSLLHEALQLLALHMQIRCGMVTLLDPQTGRIFIYEGIGLSREQIARGVYRLGEGITGRVVASGQPLVVPSIADEPDFLNRTGSQHSTDTSQNAFLCVPIARGSKVMGSLSIERHYADAGLLALDVELLSILAALLAHSVELHLLESVHKRALIDENRRLRDALKQTFKPGNIIGHSPAMDEVYRLIDKVSRTRTTVLILGESGVGKERVASAIHQHSPQHSGPFVKFNCASLPESVIESELFGHEKGAFTGATARRAGRFEEADGGTIFLDEVGELSLPMQAKLLRVLQERSFERLGSNQTRHIDVRILAATNRPLAQMVAQGQFREDLFYRLNVFPITIPPLRERRGDILLLAEHFISRFAHEQGIATPQLSTRALNRLQQYGWPGNVRELENMMERAVLLADDGQIHLAQLPAPLQTANGVAPTDNEPSRIDATIAQIEYQLIIEALIQHHGNVSAAASQLGMTRRLLGLRMTKYRLNYKMFRGKGRRSLESLLADGAGQPE